MPVGGRLVEKIPSKLVQYEDAPRSQRVGYFVENGRQISNVVQRPARDDRIEGTVSVEFLDGHAMENSALGRFGVYRRDHMAGGVERERQFASPAADLEHASRL